MKRINMIMLAVLLMAGCGKTAVDDSPKPEDIGEAKLATGFVDMGLSVRWAADNLGAKASGDDGDYYCWGCTERTSTAVTEPAYKFISSVSGEYITYGIGDELSDEDDVVVSTIGGNHRMPTYAESVELVENCDWKYVIYKGITGYTATSRINGETIFFPCCGYYAEEGLINKGVSAHVWTREVSYEYKYLGYCISASPLFMPNVGQLHRYLAIPVRAIEY